MHKACFVAFAAGGHTFFYSTFVAWTLEPHNLFLLITFSLLLLFVFFFFFHIVTHILAHHRFATTALYYFQLLHAPNVSKTIL